MMTVVVKVHTALDPDWEGREEEGEEGEEDVAA